jgi:hypothetical protein
VGERQRQLRQKQFRALHGVDPSGGWPRVLCNGCAAPAADKWIPCSQREICATNNERGSHSRLARAGRNGSVRYPQRGYQSVTHDSLPLGPVNSAVGSQKVRRKCARAHCRVDGARGWENGATMMPRAATDPVDGSIAAQEVTVGSACRHGDIVCTVDGKQRAFELPARRSVDALQSVD